MKSFGRIVFFIGICAFCALALLLLLPFLKEGFGRSESRLLFVALPACIGLGALWWLACGRTVKRSLAGWVVLAIPMVVYSGIGMTHVVAHLQGIWLARDITIQAYRESLIEWPGFGGPVGLRIEIDITHPSTDSGLIYPPELRMGRFIDIPLNRIVAAHVGGAGYFRDRGLDEAVGHLTLLKPVLFRKSRDRPEYIDRFQPGGRTSLSYNLYPGTLYQFDGEAKLCLGNRAYGIPVCGADQKPDDGCARRAVDPPIYHSGTSLSALWFVAGASNMLADLSETLTETLRTKSVLQGDRNAWELMQKRLEPDGLKAAGYRLCPKGQGSHASWQTCYCRSEQVGR